jgi:hypothetical protein
MRIMAVDSTFVEKAIKEFTSSVYWTIKTVYFAIPTWLKWLIIFLIIIICVLILRYIITNPEEWRRHKT